MTVVVNGLAMASFVQIKTPNHREYQLNPLAMDQKLTDIINIATSCTVANADKLDISINWKKDQSEHGISVTWINRFQARNAKEYEVNVYLWYERVTRFLTLLEEHRYKIMYTVYQGHANIAIA